MASKPRRVERRRVGLSNRTEPEIRIRSKERKAKSNVLRTSRKTSSKARSWSPDCSAWNCRGRLRSSPGSKLAKPESPPSGIRNGSCGAIVLLDRSTSVIPTDEEATHKDQQNYHKPVDHDVYPRSLDLQSPPKPLGAIV